ncbi:hypothetical protein C2G38_2210254 [Gigaspora rosea]|uniref:FAR1 domain-containing protein n=1 Tax=Gigaspora rosea TaxID=44941 RepID=A0A397UFI6_9GLOM|nr:hypothetical protein C2G38_2210254 [Gigaspora rosea]
MGSVLGIAIGKVVGKRILSEKYDIGEEELLGKDHYPSYESDSVNKIQPNSFEDNKERENSDDEDSDDKELKLKVGMEFKTWEQAELYLEDYAKSEGFCFCKSHCDTDPVDKNIICCRTFECSHAHIHEAEKVVLAENRRERASGMIGEHNHPMNPLITELAPRFRHLNDEMLEKIKFWTIHRRLDISIQYNLLTASFPDKKVNKKDLSNAIERYKKQLKPQQNNACQTLTNLYLKKDKDPL